MNQVLFSKSSDHWATPKYIYDQALYLDAFDPCPLYSDFDGLAIYWRNLNFVNPPFSKISQFVDKAIDASKSGKCCILLLPARTDTKWFAKLYDHGCWFYFVTGRLHFNESKNTAPFPVVFAVLYGTQSVCSLVDRDRIDLRIMFEAWIFRR